MPRFLASTVIAVLTLTGASIADESASKLDVRVLYAGDLESPRTKDFARLLERAFTRVATIDGRKLSADTARDFDVVIVDSASDKDVERPAVAALRTDFTKPAILVGAAADDVLDGLEIKLDSM